MSDGIQSIGNLISTSRGQAPKDNSAEDKFAKKQQEMKNKGIERQAASKAAGLGLSYVNLYGFPISSEALDLIELEDSIRLKLVCFYYDGKNLRIAISTPPTQEIMDIYEELCKKYFCKGDIYFVSEISMKYALDVYSRLPRIRKIEDGVSIKEQDLSKFRQEISDYRSLNARINDVNISDVVTLIMATAMQTDASDIHIEAEESGIVVRLRIDGVLQEAAVIDREKWKKIISRLKLLAKVKLNINDRPQDGRFTIHLTQENIDVRCSFLPTSFGESVVMRLLRSSSIQLAFEDLGLRSVQFETLKREIAKPNGLVLTTGPTGSGKTTTLYAILNKLNTSDTKIITLEDPIEYKLKGVNQSQVDPSGEYSFATGLRSVLRQDPDIVMVGEMRDFDTAEIAVQASLTGHLVLSTLHTNDAAGVIPRLIDMGVKPFFLVPSINCIIGQRLVRKLCPHCRIEHTLSAYESEMIGKILAVISPKSGIDIPSTLPQMYKAGSGCEHCKGIGYKGRIGIYEIFTMENNIKELTAQGEQSFKILEQAIENGMITMLQDGILKCMDGVTDYDEVVRVIGKFDYVDALYDIVVSKTIGRGIKILKTDVAKAIELARDISHIGPAIADIPVREMMNLIVASALEARAGDIHVDPTESGVRIRFRIDGILHDVVDLSKEHYISLIAQIKNLSGFALNVKKATYDGRFAIFMEGGTTMDCRVSIISGGYGETVVIRILSSQAANLNMADLGLRANTLTAVENAIQKTKGVIITTGPTGSGKTTTLYSLLNRLNRPDVKVITIEDPIEYHLEGVMQTQIDEENGYTFAAALRSLMRQNPNIIMVGEIRDPETAKTTIEAAQTGHLVLSTVHANSAAGAISRLVGLDVDRQALASSIECTIGQRLVRQICPHCKTEDVLSPEMMAEVQSILRDIDPSTGIVIPDELKFYKGTGCEHCNNIGYKGRLGIYEVITITPQLQKVMQEPTATDFDLEKAAKQNGSLLMIQDGLLKALSGDTSVGEVFRVAK